MIRAIALWFAWLVLVSNAHAVPARLPYEPPASNAPVDVRGTIWDSTEVSEDRMLIFEPDGTLSYGAGRNRNGLWRMEGDLLYFEINDGYRMFRGAVVNDRIHGDSWNILGLRWKTNLYLLQGKN